MKCPACDTSLVVVEHQQIELDLCLGGCQGLWFDHDELIWLRAEGAALFADWPPAAAAHPLRHCPRCQRVMAACQNDGIVLDRCPAGHGIWFDAGEIDQLLAQQPDQALLTFITTLFCPEEAPC